MKINIILLLTLFILPFYSLAQLNGNLDDKVVSWHYKVEGDKVVFNANIASKWHIYDLGPYHDGPIPTQFIFTLPEGVSKNGDLTVDSAPVKYYDEYFQSEIGYFENNVKFSQMLVNETSEKQLVSLIIEYQACNNQACMPPQEEKFQFYIDPSDSGLDVAMADDPDAAKSIWAIIIEAILWGFAALLTPCVFPMVPMTVSFFMKGEKSRLYSSVYGISIVCLYTLPIAIIIAATYFIGGDTVTADIFNWIATHWFPNLLFFAIFMLFAASFFGAFEITVPSKLVNNADSKTDNGGILGVFFMALTLVLVSFSCTGPIVGSILVKSTQGEIWEPILTMLAFSMAFALPFTLFAFFPSVVKKLPKSGGWLNSVKVTLGFIELALGMKFLSVADQTYHWGILDRETYLAFWIVIFFLLGLYLLGKIRFMHEEKLEQLSVTRLFLSIITFAFVLYMIPGMWGAPLKALSGYLPPISSQDFVISALPSSDVSSAEPLKLEGKPKYSDILHMPNGIQGFFDYDEALEYAKSAGKPLFVDFTGHGCVNCREMEANVWSDPDVRKILNEEYVVVALYVDDKKELPQSEWITDASGNTYTTIGKVNAFRQISMFGTNAQPYYCILDPSTEKLIVDPRAYNLDINGFIEFLKSGISMYNM